MKVIYDKILGRLRMVDLSDKKKEIPFVDTATPTINNYQRDYATKYGNVPIVSILTRDPDFPLDPKRMKQRNETATFIADDDLLTQTIQFDFDVSETGIIILG